MSNVRKLRTADDMTKRERGLNKEKVKQAKEKI
jgi:hypothetical protein